MPALVAASLMGPTGELGLLRSLRHARSLDLSAFSAAALLLLGGGDADFPVFGNLRTLLLLGCDVGADCQVLRRFLRSAPSLETITLRYCSSPGGSRSRKRKARPGERTASDDDNDDDDWCSRTAHECCRNLKSIELEFYEDEGCAIDELARALVGIAKEEPRPTERSVQNWEGKCRVRISFT
ncbi:unnamed protein product [Urochloa humidicola]